MLWKPFIEWGAAVFGALIAGNKLAETTKTLVKKADELGKLEGVKNCINKISKMF